MGLPATQLHSHALKAGKLKGTDRAAAEGIFLHIPAKLQVFHIKSEK